MKADDLEREFAPRRVAADGDLLLFEPAVALALIDRASGEAVPVIRVDGFGRPAGGVEPSGEHQADFSAAVAEGHGCWVEADAFVRERRDREIVFRVALGTDPLNAA